MPAEITWIGHASFRLSDGNSVLYIDPWKLPDSPHDADVVFVSHPHFDHCSTDDIAKVAKENTLVLTAVDTLVDLPEENMLVPGDEMAVGEVVIKTVAAYNPAKEFHPRDNHWLGAIFTLGGRRVYYAGDTDLIDEMDDLQGIDVALLPIGGKYTMNAAEAAEACERIGCAAAVPYHWGNVIGTDADAKSFADSAPCTVHVLQPGQSVTA